MIKYEYRLQTIRFGAPTLLPNGVAQGIIGFSSVYGFPDETQACIESIESIRGINGLPLYSDMLYLDFDSEDGVEEAEAMLQGMGVGFKKYTTGNRGCHFHIPTVPITSPILPSIHKAFVDNHFPKADLSLYKYSGLIRNVGTWHIKNPGKRKLLVKEVVGSLLTIEIVPPKDRGRIKFVYEELDQTEADFLLGTMLLKEIHEGKRNNTVYMMAFLAKTAGMDYTEAEDLLGKYNQTHIFPPLDNREFKSVIRSCYR
jgi:hypothetical protein